MENRSTQALHLKGQDPVSLSYRWILLSSEEPRYTGYLELHALQMLVTDRNYVDQTQHLQPMIWF